MLKLVCSKIKNTIYQIHRFPFNAIERLKDAETGLQLNQKYYI